MGGLISAHCPFMPSPTIHPQGLKAALEAASSIKGLLEMMFEVGHGLVAWQLGISH